MTEEPTRETKHETSSPAPPGQPLYDRELRRASALRENLKRRKAAARAAAERPS